MNHTSFVETSVGSTRPRWDAASAALVCIFGLTSLLSATLLFTVQPMFAKAVLPTLGGAPTVWNVCMLLFQVTLVGGYALAHGAARHLSDSQWVAAQVTLLLVAALVLPVAPASGDAEAAAHPITWLVLAFAGSVALPFLSLSSMAPAMQAWFARTRHASASDPYFLYAASNAGSLAGLVAYPVLIEPLFDLRGQTAGWASGFLALVALTGICGLAARPWSRGEAGILGEAEAGASGVTLFHRAAWIALAFVPSSHMLGLTTFLTTDLASVPLLWVVPLALYLTTFIVAFWKPPRLSRRAIGTLAPASIFVVLPFSMLGGGLPIWTAALHVVAFVAVALMCHSELARRRPAVRALTSFYLWISVGGALGGVFNALLAPVLFTSVSEYPLIVAAACGLAPALSRAGRPQPRYYEFVLPGFVLLAGIGFVAAARWDWMSAGARFGAFAGLSVFCIAFVGRPLRMVLCAAAVVLTGNLAATGTAPLLQTRTFFGVYRVLDDARSGTRLLTHGTTMHGVERLSKTGGREPLSYFHRRGPAGDVFAASRQEPAVPLDVGVIGLGAGTLAAYGRAGDTWTFFEIDPAVLSIARPGGFFTYLAATPARWDVRLGDARVTLASEPRARFDVLVLDAFSSDAIPVHLLTREALDVYLATLRPAGLLALHISNRHLELERVVSGLADSAGVAGCIRDDHPNQDELSAGHAASIWTALARRRGTVRDLCARPGWRPLAPQADARVWTDSYSNVISILKWR